jgi:Protein of unknown function (DUF3309)
MELTAVNFPGTKSAPLPLRERSQTVCIPQAERAAIVQSWGLNMLSTILLIVLILLLVGAIPSWPYSRGWGYGPSGIVGLILIILLILLLLGKL